jgi:hypothetical protein
VFERSDDSSGTIGGVFRAAVGDLSDIARPPDLIRNSLQTRLSGHCSRTTMGSSMA